MNSKLLTCAILSISMITVMASAAVSPALANISNAFPEASVNMIKTVLTLPSLFIIPFSLISGQLVRKFGNKQVLLLGILIYLVGGIAPVFIDTIPQILFYRAVLGCGCGLIMPISQALIAHNYTGDLKVKITGYSGAASYLMGVIASFIVAPISSIDWHYSFYIYLIAVVVLILNIVALPKDKTVDIKQTTISRKLTSRVWWIIVGMVLINIAFYAVPSNVALFMREQGIGSAQSAGTVISAFMIAGFFAGAVLPTIRRITGKSTIAFGLGIMALGYIVLSLATIFFSVVTGAALVGFSFGVLFPSFLILITNRCSGQMCVLALSFSCCAQFLGQFLSPYVLQAVKSVVGFESLRSDFAILAVSLSISAVAYTQIKPIVRYRLSYIYNRKV